MRTSKKEMIGRTLGELALWVMVNLLCTGLAAAAAYGAATLWAGWGPVKTSAAVTAATALSLTWGSWSALIWTRTRAVRALQHLGVMLPGLLTLLAAGAWFYMGPGGLVLGLLLVASGVGMSAIAALLAGGFLKPQAYRGPGRFLYGLTVYPVATTGLAAAVASLWLWFVSDASSGFLHALFGGCHGMWQSAYGLFSFATLMVTILATTLITTVVPAVVSYQCRRLS